MCKSFNFGYLLVVINNAESKVILHELVCSSLLPVNGLLLLNSLYFEQMEVEPG